jgi:RHS repeat-associated protein
MLRNAPGSTIGLVNAGGAIATSYGYEPFGATAASGVASSNSHRFTGREQDPTGLYYLRNRYYNPMLGRFLSPDPIGIAGGINLYGYVGNDPLDFSDPLGLKCGSGGGPVPCEACLHGPPIPQTQGPVPQGVPFHNHTDINVVIVWIPGLAGFTGGLQFGQRGLAAYVGFASAISDGYSIVEGANGPTAGWAWGVSYADVSGAAFQFGRTISSSGSDYYVERGMGAPEGANVTVYYVFYILGLYGGEG